MVSNFEFGLCIGLILNAISGLHCLGISLLQLYVSLTELNAFYLWLFQDLRLLFPLAMSCIPGHWHPTAYEESLATTYWPR